MYLLLCLLLLKIVNSAPTTESSMQEEDHHVVMEESWFDYNRTIDSGVEESLQSSVLFEGDLKIPYKQYKEYYLDENDTKEDQETMRRVERAAIKNTNKLWSSGVVYYTFHSSVRASTKLVIREAMNYIEEKTCLRFSNDSSNKISKITFKTSDSGCYTTSIGRANNHGHIINLQKYRCELRSVILHEIGHAIGFWHEHTRPDRDEYVEIQWNRIVNGLHHNFQKRTKNEVAYFNSKYDYKSIMHYPNIAFHKNSCTGAECITITVKNMTEYELQGKPMLGWKSVLSSQDILQINRMYAETCGTKAKGLKGFLNVTIKDGIGLPDTDTSFYTGKPEPFVTISAKHTGGYVVLSTSFKFGTDVTWNEQLSFGGKEWLFFKIKVWDADLYGKDKMTESETVYVDGGSHTSLKHCKAPDDCNGYVRYGYSLQVDEVDNCKNISCQNGGVCVDGVSSYTCDCVNGYEGNLCQYSRGNLKIYARYGINLPDYDNLFTGRSDPYMKVIAYDQYGNTVTKTTSYKMDTKNPTWHEWLEFGIRAWKKMEVQVFDKDVDSDDALSTLRSYNLIKGNSYYYKLMDCYKAGYVVFGCSFS